MGAAAAPSLRVRMLQHVMLPLVLIWLIGTVATLGVASYFTEQAFDRALLDDAYSIASQVGPAPDGQVVLHLTSSELTAALFDQAEAVYFSVLRPDGTRLAGEPLPPMPLPAQAEGHVYGNTAYKDQPVRAVVLRHTVDGADYHVVMAHTTRIRGALVQRLLVFGALPLLVLLGMLAIWLWRGIQRDLAPLSQLQAALAHRHAQDLSPVPLSPSTQEIDEVGQAVNALFERLGRNVRAQREFAGNVAHELRTPLAGIRALADYGLAHPGTAVSRQQLQQIASSAERAGRLVNQLLDLALADEGELVLQRERLALGPLVGQTIVRHLDKADARGVDLGARGLDEAGEDDFTVWADAALVEGILDNLVDNALRYGGRTLTIALHDTPARDACVLAVIDDGPGIPASARQALMQRWAQGRDGEKLGQGAGLGLSIVARYAQLLGSELRLDSGEDGRGLHASVTLPRA
ncbi:two-component system sensor kinase [Pseudorhodoferax aquiterrae]|uniref:histidine kinase n=1 Tax=Pseudorhodoferax aquiterrae TaxID=747304 RepID=A0ABQ3G3H2_9BURK|nr:sensor histidine kinase [Pseudorhodoferax aquiterrae]GHC85563.1 two-component system sensor kinase [Pseudorhodoferax aquiterrae]